MILAGWAHPYVSHGLAGCSNASSPVMDLAGLIDCLAVNWSKMASTGMRNWGVGGWATMCVILWQTLPGMSSWLWWRVKSKPQCAGAFQASARIMFADTLLAQHQRVWQIGRPEELGQSTGHTL